MRTTVTLDPDVERLLKDEAHKRGASFKVALNEAVRRAFRLAPPTGKRKRFVVKAYNMGPAKIDLTHTGRLIDEMEVDDFIARDLRLRQQMEQAKK